MNKMILTLIAGVLFILAAFNVFGQEKAEPPSYKEGDFWRFKVTEKDFIGYSSDALDGIYELVYSQGKVRIFKMTGDQKTEIAAKPDSSADHLLVLLGLTKDWPDLKFPLSVGQKWSYEYRGRVVGGKFERLRSVEVRVTGLEEVTTPSGTFRAFKIAKERAIGSGLNR